MSRWFVVFLVGCVSSPPVEQQPPPDVATGEVAAWQNGPALPVARANHCVVAIDDWVLAIGGNHADGTGGFVTTDEIDAAQLAPDGTLGPWHVAGKLASPASEPTCTSDGRTLYVIDGIYDNAADGGQVWSAELDATGTLSPLVSLGALPQGTDAIESAASVQDGTLRVVFSALPDSGNQTVILRTPLGGALSWSTEPLAIDFRAEAELVLTDQLAYVLGGYHDPGVGAVTDAFAAPLDQPAAKTTSLPMPIAFGKAVAVDDWLFVAGGRAQVFGAPGTASVYATPISPDGSLGTWQSATGLPVARTNHAMAVVGDYLIVTGGAANGPGDTSVLLARVRYPPTTR